MGCVTIYLDEATEQRLKASARSAGLSVSRFVSNLIRKRVATEWPRSVVALAGAWSEFSDVAQLRLDQADDDRRENL